MSTPADAIAALLALALLLLVFYGPWQEACTDLTRQIMFERRDKLFDMAADGRIAFDSLEYRSIRKGLEGLIRFAHEATWQTVLIYAIARRPADDLMFNGGFREIDKISDPNLKAEIQTLIDEAIASVMGLMAARSIILVLAVFVLVAWAICFSGVARMKRLIMSDIRPLRTISRAIEDAACGA